MVFNNISAVIQSSQERINILFLSRQSEHMDIR